MPRNGHARPGRDWRLRIEDMLGAIARVQRYTAGMTLEEFMTNDLVVDAVVRNFTVIGEAASHVPPDLAQHHPSVPREIMRRMRNVVVHEYFGVSKPILWQTVQDDLLPLVDPLRAMLIDDEADG